MRKPPAKKSLLEGRARVHRYAAGAHSGRRMRHGRSTAWPSTPATVLQPPHPSRRHLDLDKGSPAALPPDHWPRATLHELPVLPHLTGALHARIRMPLRVAHRGQRASAPLAPASPGEGTSALSSRLSRCLSRGRPKFRHSSYSHTSSCKELCFFASSWLSSESAP